MTSKELLYNTVNRKPRSRFPVGFLSPQYYFFKHKGLTEEESFSIPAQDLAKLYIDGTRSIGSDILTIVLHGTLSIRGIGGKVKFRRKGSADMEEPLIKNISDLEKIDISRLKKDSGYQKVVQTAKQIAEQAKDEFAICTGGPWGPFTLSSLMYGSDRFMRTCLKDKKAVEALLDFSLELFKANNEDIMDCCADIVSVAEPVASGDMISKKVYEELALPYQIKSFEWIKSKKCLSFLHICGNISDRLDLIRDSGLDILSLDYKVDLKKAAEVLGHKVTLAGNVDPVGIIQLATSETVAKSFQKCVEEVGDTPYILMTGCSLSPLTPPENIQAMVKIGHNNTPKGSLG